MQLTKYNDLVDLMKQKSVTAYLIPSQDEFMGEYVPTSSKRLEWLTSFSGSNGICLVTQSNSAFFTDGRYVLQAKKQLDSDLYSVHNFSDYSLHGWIQNNLNDNSIIGFDPFLFSIDMVRMLKENLHCELKPLHENLVDLLWHGRPEAPASKIMQHHEKYTGRSVDFKISKFQSLMRWDYAILTDPASICWLLNIRGADIPYTPFKLGYAVISKTEVKFFCNIYGGEDVQLPGVTLHPIENMHKMLGDLSHKKVSIDPRKSPYWFKMKLEDLNCKIEYVQDPCELPKSIKNDTELEGMRACHDVDGLALTKVLFDIKQNYSKKEFTEISIARQLEKVRRENKNFVYPSFGTIAGFKDHGAIIHYQATEQSSYTINDEGILLIDSGGQYHNGTTDVTRTLTLGKPNFEQKDRFTRVLKGHIAIASCKFPHGTTGQQLDSLARQYLWEVGLDYDHGTGHGVGSYLSVHEGPQSISKRGNDVALMPGMILSNEPGYYAEGAYGIRIENLVEVVELDSGFYGFRTLTKAPIDLELVDVYLLTKQEKDWLNNYHKTVFFDLKKLESDSYFLEQLEKSTKAI